MSRGQVEAKGGAAEPPPEDANASSGASEDKLASSSCGQAWTAVDHTQNCVGGGMVDKFRQRVHCRFCGGKKCKHEDWRHAKDRKNTHVAIRGLHSNWVEDWAIASQRPSSVLFEEYSIIEQFRACNMKAVFNLQETGEHPFCGPQGFLFPESGFSYRPEVDLMPHGVAHYNFPWPDMGTPDFELVLRTVQVMSDHVSKGERFLVHCHAGLGRTGLMLACWVMYEYRTEPRETIVRIRAQRPGSIQTSAQQKFVYGFHGFLEKTRRVFTVKGAESLAEALERQRLYLHGQEERALRYVPQLCHVALTRMLDLVDIEFSESGTTLRCMNLCSLLIASVERRRNGRKRKAALERQVAEAAAQVNKGAWDALRAISSKAVLWELLLDFFYALSEPVVATHHIAAAMKDFADFRAPASDDGGGGGGPASDDGFADALLGSAATSAQSSPGAQPQIHLRHPHPPAMDRHTVEAPAALRPKLLSPPSGVNAIFSGPVSPCVSPGSEKIRRLPPLGSRFPVDLRVSVASPVSDASPVTSTPQQRRSKGVALRGGLLSPGGARCGSPQLVSSVTKPPAEAVTPSRRQQALLHRVAHQLLAAKTPASARASEALRKALPAASYHTTGVFLSSLVLMSWEMKPQLQTDLMKAALDILTRRQTTEEEMLFFYTAAKEWGDEYFTRNEGVLAKEGLERSQEDKRTGMYSEWHSKLYSHKSSLEQCPYYNCGFATPPEAPEPRRPEEASPAATPRTQSCRVIGSDDDFQYDLPAAAALCATPRNVAATEQGSLRERRSGRAAVAQVLVRCQTAPQPPLHFTSPLAQQARHHYIMQLTSIDTTDGNANPLTQAIQDVNRNMEQSSSSSSVALEAPLRPEPAKPDESAEESEPETESESDSSASTAESRGANGVIV